MKFHLHVNQERAIALGISNINQAIILDLLCSAPTWAQAGVFNGEVYYWVARQKVCSELKILSLKPDTVYRHLVALHKLGLIDYQKDGKRDLIRITKMGASYYVGNGSEETRKQIRESSEINPTDPTTIDQINHINKKHNNANALLVREIFDYWLSIMGKNSNTKLSAKRKSKIQDRLKDYTVSEIKLAIDNCARSPFHNGQNDSNQIYNDIELICRSSEKLESFRDMPAQSGYSSTTQQNIDNLRDW